MQTTLLAEPVLTADESPVEVVTPGQGPETGEPVPGAPHVMVLRTPDERLVWLTALDSRRHDEVTASLRTFTGYLIVDGYLAYQKLLPSPATTARTEDQVRPGRGAGRAATVLPARDPPLPGRGQARPRHPAVLGHEGPQVLGEAHDAGRSRPRPRPRPPWTPRSWPTYGTATTPP